MKVLIAGAGLGGLSYGIHLNQDGLAALHACLPAKNWAQLDTAAQPARDTVRFWDQRLHVLAEIDHEPAGVATDLVTRRRAVSRTALRDALLTGLNTRTSDPADVIQWGGAGRRLHRSTGRWCHRPRR